MRLQSITAARLCTLAFMASLLASTPAAANTSGGGVRPLESAAVKAAIEQQTMQSGGPVVATQGDQGGTDEPAAPASGALQSKLATAFSDTWLVGGRHLVTRIFAAPINFAGADGSWHRIENQLVPAALGGYENKANAFRLRVPMSLSSGLSVETEGMTLTASLQGGKEAMPAVSGATARYREALSSTDFEYESTATGVKETATLRDTGAPTAIRFLLSVSGSASPTAAAGGVALVDGRGHAVVHIPAAVAYRPGQDPHLGRHLPIALESTKGGWLATVDTGEPWLRAALASGPLNVDPTLEVGGSQNCWVESDSPTGSFCSQTTMAVGYQATPAHEHHGLLQFSLASLPEGADVLNARLGLYLQSHSTSNSKPVGVYRLTKPWTTSATWEKYDATHAWAVPGGDYSNPGENSDAVVNSAVGTTNGWVYWYPTKMAQEWANGSSESEEGAPNDGIIVKDETDNSIDNVLTFSSIRATEHKPFLEVAYENPGVGRKSQWTVVNYPITDRLNIGVNVASGNLLIENQDVHIAGRGEDFASTRRYNSLDPNVHDYARFNDSNDKVGGEFADGSFEVVDETDAHFVFIKKADGSYITPPGIKAIMCTAGHSPCPSTLPAGITHRLMYEADQRHLDYNTFNVVGRRGDRHENVLVAGFTEGIGNVTSWTDTEGRKVTYKTNSSGYYTELKDEAGVRKATYGYEGTGTAAKLITYKDTSAHATKYHWEASGNLDKLTTPGGQVILLTYNEHRLASIVRTTDSEHTKGPTTSFTYYALGAEHNPCGSNLKATVMTDPDGETHTATYCSNVHGEIVRTINAAGKETTATFDRFGNMITTTAAPRESGASPGVSTAIYGTGGQNLTCNVLAAKEAETCPGEALPEGYASRYGYTDANYVNQPTEAISARLKNTTLCYWGGSTACGSGEAAAPGELKQEKLPLSGEPGPSYEYDSRGLKTASVAANGQITKYNYDTSGNLESIVPPAGAGRGKVTITVDALSRPHVITQCLNESCTSSATATLTYDALDRVTEAVNTGPSTTKTFKYTYDNDGNLVKRIDPTGTTTFKRDPLNRVTEETLPGTGKKNSYGYDQASNLTTFTDSGGTTTYLYNTLNEVEAMYDPGGNCGATPVSCTRFTYDDDGALRQIKYSSGATLNYVLDATTGRPTKISAKSAAGTTLLSNEYTYTEGTSDTPLIRNDLYSGPTGTTSTTYAYDELDRLIKAETVSTPETLAPSCYLYAYDATGNRTSEGYTATPNTCTTSGPSYNYNSGNELECRMKVEGACSKSSSSEISGYSYNGAGDLTAITGYNDPATTSLSYNNLSQLQGLTPPSSGEQAVAYLGSGQGNLTTFGASTLQNSALGATKQINSSGTSYYARTPEGMLIDERLPGGAAYNPVYDAQGDVVGLLNSSGELVQTLRYGPYGENTVAEGSLGYSTTSDPFMYQGGYHVAGGNTGSGNVPNGLYHFGDRYYDPTIGRWTQAEEGGAEGYIFAADNPVNACDANGTTVEWAMLTPERTRRLAGQIEDKANNATFIGIVLQIGGALGIPGWTEIAGSSEGVSAYYKSIAHNLRACAEAAARCFVTVWYKHVWPWTIITRVSEEPCLSWRWGYFLCEPSLYVRRGNVKGKR
jgi:RHS repeat-associated protein